MILLRLPLYFLRLGAQSVFLALGQIWANKVRAALTTIGIIISVASVTAVVAVLTGMKTQILSEFESFGTNKIYVVPQWPREGPLRRAPWYQIRFMPEQFRDLARHCPSVMDFTMICDHRETVQYGDRSEENVQVLAVQPAWHEIENRPVELGRSFTVVDESQSRTACLVTPQLRDKLHLDRECVGESILVGDRLFQIVGVVAEQPTFETFHGPEVSDCQMLIPFGHAWKTRKPWFYVIARSRTPEQSEEAAAEVRFYLRRTRNLKPGDPDTFRLEVMQVYLEQFRTVALAITIVAAGIVGISLVVGGVGIMNIMLVSVSERTREIGLRKAVGARPSAILLQFLVEAVTLCFLGGLAGILVGQGLTSGIASIPGAGLEKAYIPVWAIVLSFGFAAAVGLFFGMFPAVKAARLDPIEALRHE
jgi:putative ABC transport system permease protein